MRSHLLTKLLISMLLTYTACETQPQEDESVFVCDDLSSCYSDSELFRRGKLYIEQRDYRRQVAEQMFVNEDNIYARTRLNTFALEQGGWDDLPQWLPSVTHVSAQAAGNIANGMSIADSVGDTLEPIWDGQTPETIEQWRQLGERVFWQMPLRSEIYLERIMQQPDKAAEFGVLANPDGNYTNMIAFKDTDGRTRLGLTCSSCHSAQPESKVVNNRWQSDAVARVANRRFDYGAMAIYITDTQELAIPQSLREVLESWGPGRADISEDRTLDPLAVPDIYDLAGMRFFTHGGTIKNIGPEALAVRQETQYTDAHKRDVRPPRVLVWALVTYLSQAVTINEPATSQTSTSLQAIAQGQQVFEQHCSSCHRYENYSGDIIDAAIVGTDQGLALGQGRGTGSYRPAALYRLKHNAPYMHDGSIASLDELLNSERLEPNYERELGSLSYWSATQGAIEGHTFGMQLSESSREDLKRFLRSL